MARENVLELKIVKMHDKYSAVTITKQDDNVIKRGKFNFKASNNIEIVSLSQPEFYLKCLYIRGDNELQDNDVLIIKNENIPLIEVAVKELNEKYRIKENWRANKGEDYYLVYTDGDIGVDIIKDLRVAYDNSSYSFGNYFRTKEQAEECTKRIKKVIDDYHEEIGE